MRHIGRIALLVVLILALAAVARPGPSLAGGEVRVLVQFVPGHGAAVHAALQGAGGNIHYQFDDLDTFAVTLPEAALAGIQRNPNLVLVEEDAPRYLMSQDVPWGVDAVQAPQAWTQGATGSGVKVCIIDSGLYTGHEDATPNIAGGYGTNWNVDGCGHGTHVAGTIAAVNNTVGVVGVSPGVSLYIVRVFGDDCGWTYISSLVAATQYCDSAGANIISMSLGGARSSRTERTQFDALYTKGILSIAAAGNDGNTAYSYPASYSSVVSVAAIDSAKIVADFSQKNDQVELAAPGVGVLSTVPWVESNSLTVDGVVYSANHVEYAARGTAAGVLENGGLCGATNTAWSGKVVLCERGTYDFLTKVMNVQTSGGAAAVIYNNVLGNFLGTLGDGNSSTIPAISLSQEYGQYLVANKLASTGNVASSIAKPASGYEAWDGTSMATPHVSAVAALLWSAKPSATNAEIRAAMTASALDLGAAGKDNAYGYGLVQAKAALDSLGGGTTPPTTMHISSVEVTAKFLKPGSTGTAVVTIVDAANTPVSGATVTGVWSGSYISTTPVSGVTGTAGTVTFTTPKTKNATIFTFTVTNVVKDGAIWDRVEKSDTISK